MGRQSQDNSHTLGFFPPQDAIVAGYWMSMEVIGSRSLGSVGL